MFFKRLQLLLQKLSRLQNFLALMLVILVASGVGFAIFRYDRPPLSPAAMDLGQVARNVAEGRGFTTSILLPFAAPWSAGRSYSPELLHEPLFPLVAALAFVVFSPSDAVLIALSTLFFILSAALLFALARRLSASNWLLAFSASALYIFSFPVLRQATSGTPETLSTALVLLLLLLLTPPLKPTPIAPVEAANPDVAPKKRPKRVRRENPRRAQNALHRRYLAAGVVLGLCFLNDYVLLLPIGVLAWIWAANQDGWNRNTTRRFLFGFVLICAPWWFRNFRLTGNPFYTLQWFELAMQTKAFPGQTLLRDFEQGKIGTLIGLGPGPGEIIRKVLSGLQSFFQLIPQLPHPYLMPFILLALGTRSRFSGIEQSRIKLGLGVALIILVFLLSFLGRTDASQLQPLIPLLCLLGALALQELFALWETHQLRSEGTEGRVARSRSSLSSFARARVLAVVALVVLLFVPVVPVFATVWARRPPESGPLSPRSQAIRKMGDTLPEKRVVVSDVPWEVTWYSKRDGVLLPNSPTQMSAINKVRNISALFLSPGVVQTPVENAALVAGQRQGDPWSLVYNGREELQGYSKAVVSRAGDILYLRNPTVEEARKTARDRPKDANAILTQGYAELVANRAQDAQRTFTRVISMQPKWTQAFLGRGEALIKLRRFDESARDFSRALALSPRSLSAQMGVADAQLARGQHAQALQSYERVLADYPNHLIAINNLSYLYSQNNRDLNRAMQMARRAAELAPRNSQVLDTLGWACYRTQRLPEAVTYLSEAVRLEPENGLFHYHLGKSLLAAKQTQNGFASMQKALDLGLPASEGSDARRIIAFR